MAQRVYCKNKDHSQKVILAGENGHQENLTLDCFVIIGKEKGKIQFPRTVEWKNRDYRLIKYSEKQDVLFYKIVPKGN